MKQIFFYFLMIFFLLPVGLATAETKKSLNDASPSQPTNKAEVQKTDESSI